MKRTISTTLAAALVATIALGALGASADTGLKAGVGVRTITPVGAPPAGWDFWMNPATGVWSEEFTDDNGNGYWDPGEPFVDDPANSMLDPQSTGEFDGCWTNAGFSGKGPLGKIDDVWARAIVLDQGDTRVAIVSLDVVGFFYDEIEDVRVELDATRADHGVDKVIVSSTHTHEACDTMGLWGNPGYATDGKFPLYQAFIRSMIVESILEGVDGLTPARVQAATTTHTAGIRDSRPPHVIDPYVQAARFVDPDGETIATMVNWSNHPEALGSSNRFISSDFPHGTREAMEAEYGAPSVYFSGSVGGLMTPLRVDMGAPYYDGFRDPEGNPLPFETAVARTYYIGELVAEAAIDALTDAPIEEPESLEMASEELYIPGDNYSLRVLNAVGIFDKPTYTAGVDVGPLGDEFRTELVTVGFGSIRIQTVPGELFPEIEIGGYGRPDCEAADTGRPYEPVIAEQFEEEHLFTLGLAQDELGYIVPGYDFWIAGAPDEVLKQTVGTDAQPRPLIDIGVLEAEDPCGEGHYEETVSGSSVLAPVVACTAARLAGKDTSDPVAYPACTPENTTVGPQGLHLDALGL